MQACAAGQRAGDAGIAERGRFRDSDLLRKVFEDVVARCIAEGVVGGERFATDASLISADANRQNSTSKEEWDPTAIDPNDAPKAVQEYLDDLDDEAFGEATLNRPGFTGERLVPTLGCFFIGIQGFIEHLLCFMRRDISNCAVKTLGVVPINLLAGRRCLHRRKAISAFPIQAGPLISTGRATL
jgi:hypothetical protein